MIGLKKGVVFLAVLGTLMFLAAPAVADWDEGDGHKMHFPQLPDPYGWDVAWPESGLFGDDWQCSQTGPVSDIHLWVSFKKWNLPEVPDAMTGVPVFVQIWSNDPGGAGSPYPYSTPKDLLREWTFDPGDYTIRHYGTGDQGWYWPESGEIFEHDHTQYFQINIDKIMDPFIQEEGKIYWLTTQVNVPGNNPIGWKTTATQFMDDAVFYSGGEWQELRIGGELHDLAFVITPEPGTLVLLVTAGLGLLLFAWRRRK